MKKGRVTSSKKTKTETIAKPKNVIDLGEELPIFSIVSNVYLGNLNLSVTMNKYQRFLDTAYSAS